MQCNGEVRGVRQPLLHFVSICRILSQYFIHEPSPDGLRVDLLLCFMSSSTSASLDVGNDGTFYQMTLRTDRPIEGCELSPYPFLYLKGGTLDNGARQKKMDSNPHKFSFRWFRKPRRQICQNNQCPRRSTYDPVYWTKTAIGGSSLRCATCEKAGVAVHLSLFCSSRYCFNSDYGVSVSVLKGSRCISAKQ